MDRARKMAPWAVAFVVGIAVGVAGGTQDGIEAATATATPLPTPTAEPTPEPTPIVVELEVEVLPAACREALDAAERVLGSSADFVVDVLSAYVDYPDEDLLEFGVRVEDLIVTIDSDRIAAELDDYTAALVECEAATAAGTST